MAVRRALVDCAVLCVQEGSVVYPFCNNCYSRIDVQLQDYKRCACSKCGYNCPKAQVGYRYRLSLRVARQMSIFGVTVFGTCLDPFFGIHASGLQRLVEEEPVQAATRAALLKQAVEDCFIGRHFIFGIKVKDTDRGPWFDGSSGVTVGTTARPAQFIATQIHLPPAGGGAGCSVLRYYHALLQRARALRSSGSSEALKPAAPFLLPLPSPGRAVLTTTTTPPHSPLLSRSLYRLMYHGSVLSPDSPWQRSLGVVTSSAEQDTQQDEGDEHDGRPPHHHHHSQPNERPAETQRAPATALHSGNEKGFSIGHSFTCSLWSPYAAEASSNAPLPPTCPSPLPSHHSSPESQQVDVPACDPLAWEDDMVYSESLEAFIVCQENWSENRTASSDRCHRNRRRSAHHSRRRTLADVSNTCAPRRACDAMHKSARRVNEVVDTRGTPVCGGCSSLVSFDPMGGQGFHVDGPGLACDGDGTDDVYNCSADLFSDPMAVVTLATQELGPNVGTTAANGQIIVTHKDTQTLNTDANTDEPTYTQPRAWSSLDSPESAARSDRHLEYSTLPALPFLFTSHKHGVGCSRYRATDSNECPPLRNQTTLGGIIHGSDPVPLDFIPPSQSTPLQRTCVHTGSGSAAVHRTRAASRPLGCLKPDRQPPRPACIITSTPPPPGCSGSHRFTASHQRTQQFLELHPVVTSKTPARKNHNLNLTSRRRLRNLDRANCDQTSRQILNLQCRTALGLTDMSISVMCVDDDNDKVVTPSIGEMSFPVSARQGEHADGCIRQTPSWEISGAQTNAVESKTWGRSAEAVRRDGSVHHFLFDEKQDFDLSGDLFADSFH